MNRRERRNKQRQEKRVLRSATQRWVRTLKRPCASCGAGPSWQILQDGSDVAYQCVECEAEAFRIPFDTPAFAAAYVKGALEAEAAAS